MNLPTNVLFNSSPAGRREDSRKTSTLKMGWKQIRRFLVAEDGPTAVEYAVMLMLVVAVCISAVSLIGHKTQDSFAKSANSISNAIKSAP